MRHLLKSAISTTLLLSTLCFTQSATAQLQWKSSGVRQAAHQAETPAAASSGPATFAVEQASQALSTSQAQSRQTVVATKPVRMRAKAPQLLNNTPPVPTASVSNSLKRANQRGMQVLQQAAYSVPQIDNNVAPACHNGSCGLECGCGMTTEASCGFAEPTCGITMGEQCGCGSVGCAGECGEPCGCGDVCSCGIRGAGLNGIGLGCEDRGAVPLVLYVPPIQELTFFGGVHAFKSALDEGRDRGNFGIHEGVNVGGRMSWLPFTKVGYQIGYQATHSQLHGDAATATAQAHTQQFFTAGLFHRRPVGLQYGLVYDMLHDERQIDADFSQVRGLLSITNPRGHEFGFTFTSHLDETFITVDSVNTKFHAVDKYLFFYRKHGCDGGEFRLFGGMDNDGVGILGGDIDIPISDRWSLQTGFTYLVPEDDAAGIGGTEEAWNLGTNLVWHFGNRAKRSYKGQYRPMFNVADNGSLIVDDRP